MSAPEGSYCGFCGNNPAATKMEDEWICVGCVCDLQEERERHNLPTDDIPEIEVKWSSSYQGEASFNLGNDWRSVRVRYQRPPSIMGPKDYPPGVWTNEIMPAIGTIIGPDSREFPPDLVVKLVREKTAEILNRRNLSDNTKWLVPARFVRQGDGSSKLEKSNAEG
jgi:hypothetical protein